MYPKASSYPLGKVHAHSPSGQFVFPLLFSNSSVVTSPKLQKPLNCIPPNCLKNLSTLIGQLNMNNGQTDVLIIQTVYLTHFVLSTFLFWTFGFLTINQKFPSLKVYRKYLLKSSLKVYRKYLFGYRNRTAEKVVCVLGWNVPMEICHLFLSNQSLIPVLALLVGQFFCK